MLDCFCGSGTTLKAAHQNNRQWIGIDESEEAIKATIKKLNEIAGDLFVSKADFKLLKDQAHRKTKVFSKAALDK